MGTFKMYYALDDEKKMRQLPRYDREALTRLMENAKAREVEKQQAASVDKDAVHRAHCCVAHGCKYNDRDCPVETGRMQQDHLCEYCDHDGIMNWEHLRMRVRHSMNTGEPLISVENYTRLYGEVPKIGNGDTIPVSVELMQRVWLELYRSPEGKEHYDEFVATIDDVINLLDEHDVLPDLDE